MCYLHIIFLGIFTNSTIIFHELIFFKQILFLKKLFPRKKIVHYCTELYTEEDEPSHKKLLELYKKNSNISDLIIECEENREKLRKEMYGITKPTIVIPNTIPIKEIPIKAAKGSLAKLAGIGEFPKGVPVIVYTGGAYFHRELDRIVEGLCKTKEKIFFLAFCYGDNEAIEELREICNKKFGSEYNKVCNAVPRERLLECINEANAGIVYYRPSLSIGNLYASPTKLFEYIGAGVPVISSNNPSIVELVNKYNLGICVKDESVEAITEAVENLVFNKEKMYSIKDSEEKVFTNKLCYEEATKESIKRLVEFLRNEE